MDQYIYSCVDLASKADKGMKEEKKVKAIIRGLLPHYFHQTFIKKFATVAELITHLHSLADAQYVYDRKGIFGSDTSSATAKEIQELKSLIKQMAEVQVNAIQAQNNNQHTGQGRSNDGKIICFRCNKAGHMASKCTNRPYCLNCKRELHQTRSCWNKDKKVADSSTSQAT